MSSIIIRPLITEKMTAQGEKEGRYGFVVDRRSNKLEIRDAVEKEFNVTVTGVRTMIVRGKKRTRYTKSQVLRGSSSSWKKAIVTLAQGDSIDFFSNL
ncbi:MAG: 50S ribosomal protein L23 [Flavobacteriales bacterium]|nr:50S ribosomal protein L23 [Flavobacteriales bacterium]MEB2340747.1 50S ribosomal protein L23 [Flavobacteriia bacterium]